MQTSPRISLPEKAETRAKLEAAGWTWYAPDEKWWKVVPGREYGYSLNGEARPNRRSDTGELTGAWSTSGSIELAPEFASILGLSCVAAPVDDAPPETFDPADARYIEDHFENLLSCHQCWAERWLNGTKDDDRSKYRGIMLLWYRKCNEVLNAPHRCGKSTALSGKGAEK